VNVVEDDDQGRVLARPPQQLRDRVEDDEARRRRWTLRVRAAARVHCEQRERALQPLVDE